jgi:MoaA/NifB/PqqE/SkfB family radical SAM enzyme
MLKECPGGREKLCISPYGEVIGCGMNYISFGNVLQEPLENIWERTCEWPPFKKRSKKCLIALDEEYLEEYLLPVAGYETLPVSIEQHPVHPMKLPVEKDR